MSGGRLIPDSVMGAFQRQIDLDAESIRVKLFESISPRSMVTFSTPVIVSGHVLPRYGTVLRHKTGDGVAMYLGRDTRTTALSIPGNTLIDLDEGDVHTISDMNLMKHWEIVEESKV